MSKKEDRNIKSAQSSTHMLGFSILCLHVIDYLSGPMIPLWASYYPVAQTKVEGWLRRPYTEPVTRRSDPQGCGTT